ncbi:MULTISPECIES: IclR family transcriptional regulator domain-containing protein [Azospirillum]|nr:MULTISPECIES: helix-turn-helix domain-containing protein [Azospirillum]
MATSLVDPSPDAKQGNVTSMPSFKPVAALTRGLDVLRIVNELRDASVAALHRETGLDKATIVRMLETLEHEGYVTRNPSNSGYVPTGRTLQLSRGYDLHHRIGLLCEPILTEFRQAIGWPSDVALFDHDAMIVVQTSRETGPLFFNRRPGFRAPILETSIGRAYLAFCADSERERILARLRPRTDPANALASDPQRLEALLSDVRARGFACMDDSYSDREYSGQLWAMAVPVRDEQGILATLNIMMLRSAVSPEAAQERFLDMLITNANRLAHVLRHASWG